MVPGAHTGLGRVPIPTSQLEEVPDSWGSGWSTHCGLPSVVRKTNRHPKKQENTAHHEEKYESIKTNPQLTQMSELADEHVQNHCSCIPRIQKVN